MPAHKDNVDKISAFPDRFGDVVRESAGKAFCFDHNDMRTLHLDSHYVQSAMSLSKPFELLLQYTKTMMGFLLFQREPQHILLIGLGGGSLAKYCYHRLPNSRITVIELDSNVIDLRDKFYIPRNDRRFRIIHADAAKYITDIAEKADIILHDGFTAEGLAPSLCTLEFYGKCFNALRDGGVLVSNVWGNAPDILAVMKSLHVTFDGLLWWSSVSGSYNRIVFSAKGLDPADISLSSSGNLAFFRLFSDINFPAIVKRLKTSCGKSSVEFEAMAGPVTLASMIEETCAGLASGSGM